MNNCRPVTPSSSCYLVSDGGQQSVKACCEEHSSSKRVTERQESPVPVRLLVVDQQEANWDQYAGQHETEQAQQAEQLCHQDLHPEEANALQTLEERQRHHTADSSFYWTLLLQLLGRLHCFYCWRHRRLL